MVTGAPCSIRSWQKFSARRTSAKSSACGRLVAAINDLEPQIQPLSDAELAAKTAEFKQRIANGEPIDDLLIEAFAVTREVGRRVLNMRHFDVQLIGGTSCIRARSPKCEPVKERRWWRRCRCT